MIRLFFAIIALGLLTGCTALAPVAAPVLSSYGSGSAAVQSQTSVNLSSDNFVVTQTNATGRSKGFSLLGVIPIYPARLTTAMNRMYAKSGIEIGSTKSAAHLTIERSSTYWILFSIPETIVCAQIVQFTPPVNATNSPALAPEKP